MYLTIRDNYCGDLSSCNPLLTNNHFSLNELLLCSLPLQAECHHVSMVSFAADKLVMLCILCIILAINVAIFCLGIFDMSYANIEYEIS